MKELIQIQTDIFRASYANSRSLIFLAEGYSESDESLFYRDVYDLLNKLENSFPFSCLKGNGNRYMFSVFVSFSPSVQYGYANSQQEAVGRTVFETYFENGKLHVNHTKINSYIDDLIYTGSQGNAPFFVKNSIPKGITFQVEGLPTFEQNKLVFILLPEANRTDIELEVDDIDTYYSILTSVDNHSEQIIQKATGRILGLADEFDLPGADYLKPVDIQGDFILSRFPNLFYAPNITIGPNPTINDDFPWRWGFDKNYNSSIPIFKNTAPANVNRDLPLYNVSYTDIELWEGGGGFRTDVYRSAPDCIMRRKIGDNTLPLKDHKVAFCPICRELLSSFLIIK
ncbi:hypothetical protein H1R17_09590 [Flavobacterium sp. xlx-214]|uniref:hypothetical protein n=1 Tax=unclassified Flavobacterium TaxID=196869 RepID=UPI0013D758EA|nr:MULTISPECIES: hypothetical protein [unclassified Flavobacterium]MBA5793510.1 hypothetical protein [Flavobacterium sp. xlx-221]QMI82720.1 hypothetical protein H1R17_09590 [Flavobacterium sp. xlx-214]